MVKLEQNTVRFLDNFSAGTRGAASAEYLLKTDKYAVIFLHRHRSLEPFERRFKQMSILDIVNIVGSNIELNEQFKQEYSSVLHDHQAKLDLLLKIDFQTVSDYLTLLKYICTRLSVLNKKALVYLAAAVSDFYLPKDEIPLHKIQSIIGSLNINLKQVPKLLGLLASDWCKNAFIVSFKLETDSSMLYTKCKSSLLKYKHNLVIGNILNERKTSVYVLKNDEIDVFHEIRLSQDKLDSGDEIESHIIKYLVHLHDKFIGSG